MEWSTKRRITYALSIGICVSAVIVFIFQNILFPDPTCYDNKKNGFESGLDCGGSCSLRCEGDVVPLEVAWARAVSVGTSSYDIVGLMQNKNINNAPKNVGYTFTVYGKTGEEIKTITGTTTVPVDDDTPIIIQNVALNQEPARTVLVLSKVKHYATKEKVTVPPIRTLHTKFENGQLPRLYVTIQNATQLPFANLPVSIILYDDDQNAMGVGETIVPYLEKEEQKDLVFTWNQPLVGLVSKTRVYYELRPF